MDTRNCGLAAEPGVLSFTRGQDMMNHVAATAEAGSAACVSVPVTTFDALAAGGCPLLAKIDVEGYETSNSRFGFPQPGACRRPGRWWMRSAYPPYTTGAAVGWIRRAALCQGLSTAPGRAASTRGLGRGGVLSDLGAGFAPYRYEPFSRRLEPLEGPNRDGGNTLFLRDLPFVQGRVKGAAAVDVRGVAL